MILPKMPCNQIVDMAIPGVLVFTNDVTKRVYVTYSANPLAYLARFVKESELGSWSISQMSKDIKSLNYQNFLPFKPNANRYLTAFVMFAVEDHFKRLGYKPYRAVSKKPFRIKMFPVGIKTKVQVEVRGRRGERIRVRLFHKPRVADAWLAASSLLDIAKHALTRSINV